MRTTRLYVNSTLATDTTVELPPETSHYLGKVLRAKAGQAVILFNGDGQEYAALITQVTKKTVVVTIESSQLGLSLSPLYTHLGQVMSRGDRMDYAIQKATEMGANEITPLFSDRCEVKLDPKRLDKRLLHWRQISISA
ncbi:MAG: RsmE family RNA methyltransferase, partial [Pseudomonadales bacterium]